MRDKGSGIQIKTSVVSASLQARATLAHSECHTDWYQMTKQPFVFMQQRRGTTYQQNSGFNWNLLFAFLLDYIYTSTTRCPISPTLQGQCTFSTDHGRMNPNNSPHRNLRTEKNPSFCDLSDRFVLVFFPVSWWPPSRGASTPLWTACREFPRTVTVPNANSTLGTNSRPFVELISQEIMRKRATAWP